jgi:site-specific recombinase XerD
MLPGARVSGASMRIACATLRQRNSCAPGASLPEIGQLLRHRRAATTAIYAKVDRDSLRLIARPWPEGNR